MKLNDFTADYYNSSIGWTRIKLELPAELVERSSGKPISPKAHATIYQQGTSNLYTLQTSGGHKSSNRWYKEATLQEAKAKASAWAARRYKLEAKGE